MHRRPFRLQLKFEDRGHKNDKNDDFSDFDSEFIFEAGSLRNHQKAFLGVKNDS